MKSLLKFSLMIAAMAMVLTGCQKDSADPEVMLKKAAAYESYDITSSTDCGYSFTITIDKMELEKKSEFVAKDISHVLIKLANCSNNWLIEDIISHIKSFKVNGVDYTAYIEPSIGQGTGCWFSPLDATDPTPWDSFVGRVFKVNFEDGLMYPVTIEFTLDVQAAWGYLMIKAGNDYCGGAVNNGGYYKFMGFCGECE